MRKFLYLLPAVALLASGGSALAEGASGIVEMVDAQKRTLELVSGETFQVDETTPVSTLEQIKPGDTVLINYEEQDGEMVATNVELQGREGN